MLFNSLEFLVFFPIVLALYYALPHRFRWILLLLASYYFYMCWNAKFVVLLFTATLLSYVNAIWISRSEKPVVRNSLLLITVVLLIGPLFFFKYFNFFSDAINGIADQFRFFHRLPIYDLLLPVGISFYTFQALGYTIDVYRQNIKPEYHLGKFALFTAFFPQLLAGPIGRAAPLIPQFSQKTDVGYANIRDGIALMVWGFFKKVVIADRLSEYVNLVYNNPQAYEGLHYLVATLFFAVQIYCDFSGYTDIARGIARMMGINLMVNFRMPYLSSSIREFWQRWHISLTTWFRDYLFLPLSIAVSRNFTKEKVGFIKTDLLIYIIASTVTWFITGLWHGANYTFIVWGLIHGIFLILYQWLHPSRKKFLKNIKIRNDHPVLSFFDTAVTLFIVTFAWIFFKSDSMGEAFYIIKGIAQSGPVEKLNLFSFSADFAISLVLIFILFTAEILEEKIAFSANALKRSPAFIKWALLITLVLSIFILGKWEDIDFLYFQF